MIQLEDEHFELGLCHNQRENYYCGYKNMVTLNVNLMMFQFMSILLDKKNGKIYSCLWDFWPFTQTV